MLALVKSTKCCRYRIASPCLKFPRDASYPLFFFDIALSGKKSPTFISVKMCTIFQQSDSSPVCFLGVFFSHWREKTEHMPRDTLLSSIGDASAYIKYTEGQKHVIYINSHLRIYSTYIIARKSHA